MTIYLIVTLIVFVVLMWFSEECFAYRIYNCFVMAIIWPIILIIAIFRKLL